MTLPLHILRLLFVAGVFALGYPLAAYSQDEDEAPDRLVTLDASTVLRLGIVTAPIKSAEYRAETNGFGLVIAYDALAQTDADLATAEAMVVTSETARTRARQLFSADVSVSRQTLEAAERQAVADRAQLSLVQRKAEASWGQSAPWHTAADLSRLLMRLSAGDVALMRVTFSGAIGANAPASFKVQRVEAGAKAVQWTAKTIWRAPADPTVPGVSFFALVEKARSLLPGERLLVFLPGENSQQGAVIPADAMLVAEGSCWYYLSEDQSLIIPLAPLKNFTRVALDTSRPTAEGYFVTAAAPGQTVVVEGGGLLLARETGATEEDD